MASQEIANEVTRLYAATFNRPPDAAGLSYWDSATDEGFTVAQIAQSFSQAPEFIQDYGALTDAGFVTQLYQNVLGRGPDLPGQAYWVQALATGSTRGTILNDFAQSPENVTHTAIVNAPAAAPAATATPTPTPVATPAPTPAPLVPTVTIGGGQLIDISQSSTGTVLFALTPPIHQESILDVSDATPGGTLGSTVSYQTGGLIDLPGLTFNDISMSGNTVTLSENGTAVYTLTVAPGTNPQEVQVISQVNPVLLPSQTPAPLTPTTPPTLNVASGEPVDAGTGASPLVVGSIVGDGGAATISGVVQATSVSNFATLTVTGSLTDSGALSGIGTLSILNGTVELAQDPGPAVSSVIGLGDKSTSATHATLILDGARSGATLGATLAGYTGGGRIELPDLAFDGANITFNLPIGSLGNSSPDAQAVHGGSVAFTENGATVYTANFNSFAPGTGTVSLGVDTISGHPFVQVG